MSTIYCLGGTSRSGKTQIMQRFLTVRPVPAISTDSIRHLLKCLPNAQDFPDLFAQRPIANLNHEARASLQEADGERYIELQNRESAVVWPAVASYIEANRTHGIDIFVEGIAILPEYAAALPGDVKAVFIGNQSGEHWRDMYEHASRYATDGLNSLHMVSNEEIAGLGRLYKVHSKMMENEAKKYGFTYIEMSQGDFSDNIDKVIAALQDS